VLKRNQESWSNCLTDQLHKEAAIRIWNSTKTGNKGSIYNPIKNIYEDIAPLNNYSNKISIAELKKSLRYKFLSKRCSLSNESIQKNSKLICDSFAQLNAFKQSSNIAIYYPVKNEVDTLTLFNTIQSAGKYSYFPKVADGKLYFHKIRNLNQLETGYYGIPEPGNSVIFTGINEIDLFIVPGLCFDLKGSRLGYGKGLYDQALKNISSSKLYAFCYKFQILNELPSDKDDKRVGHLISESDVVSCKI